jgi:hypothetical protein
MVVLQLNHALLSEHGRLSEAYDPSLIMSLSTVLSSGVATDVALYPTLRAQEYVCFFGGPSIDELLKRADSLRMVPASFIESWKGECANLFGSLETLPLVRYGPDGALPASTLKGDIQPILFLGCRPGAESTVGRAWRSKHTSVRHAFGRSDLVVEWKKPVSAASFVQQVVAERKHARTSCDLLFTSTTLSLEESDLYSDLADEESPASSEGTEAEHRPDLAEIDDFMKRIINMSESSPEADAFLAELQAVILECRSTLARLDRSNSTEIEAFLHVTLEVADEIMNGSRALEDTEAGERTKLEERLSSLKTALAQRAPRGRVAASGLSSALSANDGYYGRVLQAAAFIPMSLHDLCTRHLPPSLHDWKGDWLGFIEFGERLGPNAHEGEVIELPRYFVFTPFENWWMISHEAWHTLYVRAFEREYGWVVRELEQRHGGMSAPFVKRMTRELFANWMDCLYCFSDNIDSSGFPDDTSFQRLVWSHWSRLFPRTELPLEYLQRSFLIHLYSQGLISDLQALADRRPGAVRSELHKKWEGFVERLSELDTAKPEIIRTAARHGDDVVRAASPFIDLISFFEKRLSFRGMHTAFNPPAIVDEKRRLSAALRGTDAMPQTIDRPIALLVQTGLDRLDGTPAGNAVETAALVYSLAKGRTTLIDRADLEPGTDGAF